MRFQKCEHSVRVEEGKRESGSGSSVVLTGILLCRKTGELEFNTGRKSSLLEVGMRYDQLATFEKEKAGL